MVACNRRHVCNVAFGCYHGMFPHEYGGNCRTEIICGGKCEEVEEVIEGISCNISGKLELAPTRYSIALEKAK